MPNRASLYCPSVNLAPPEVACAEGARRADVPTPECDRCVCGSTECPLPSSPPPFPRRCGCVRECLARGGRGAWAETHYRAFPLGRVRPPTSPRQAPDRPQTRRRRGPDTPHRKRISDAQRLWYDQYRNPRPRAAGSGPSCPGRLQTLATACTPHPATNQYPFPLPSPVSTCC